MCDHGYGISGPHTAFFILFFVCCLLNIIVSCAVFNKARSRGKTEWGELLSLWKIHFPFTSFFFFFFMTRNLTKAGPFGLTPWVANPGYMTPPTSMKIILFVLTLTAGNEENWRDFQLWRKSCWCFVAYCQGILPSETGHLDEEKDLIFFNSFKSWNNFDAQTSLANIQDTKPQFSEIPIKHQIMRTQMTASPLPLNNGLKDNQFIFLYSCTFNN